MTTKQQIKTGLWTTQQIAAEESQQKAMGNRNKIKGIKDTMKAQHTPEPTTATLKKALRTATHCTIQHNGWTCGTCFFAISKKLTNADWQAVLLKRGDNAKEDLHNLPKDIGASLQKVLKLAQGNIR